MVIAGMFSDFEVCVFAVGVRDEGELQGFGSWSESMFYGEEEFVIISYEVGVAVTEGVKVAGAAQCLSELCAVFLAHVMYEDDGHVELSLYLAQETE